MRYESFRNKPPKLPNKVVIDEIYDTSEQGYVRIMGYTEQQMIIYAEDYAHWLLDRISKD